MAPWGDKLGEGFYEAKGLKRVAYHIEPELKERLIVAGIKQNPRLSMDKMTALIVRDNLARYESGPLKQLGGRKGKKR